MKNKDIFLKTKRKIINTSLSILIIGVLIFSIVIFGFYSFNIFSNIDTELTTQSNKVIFQLTNDNNFPRNQNTSFLKNVFSRNHNVTTLIYFEDKLIYDTPNTYYLDHDFSTPIDVISNELTTIEFTSLEIPSFNNDGVSITETENYNFRILSIDLDESITIQTFMNIQSEIQSLDLFLNVMIISFIFIISICYFLSLYLSSSVLKPIKKSYDSQLQFIQDASHEMRTPLAIIKGKIEILSNKPDDKIDDHFEGISSIISEIRGLEKLNRNLLQLSKEDVIAEINIKEVNLNNFINDICDFYAMLAESQDKEFILNLLSQDLLVNWDTAKMQQALIIILENAFKYSKEGDKVILSLFNNKNKIIIEISDTGLGIKEDELPKIFDRFYRSDTVRGNNIPGSGIGLSLLKSLSNVLDFDVEVLSTINEGTRFILTIPINM